MKKLSFLFILALLLGACQNKKSKTSSSEHRETSSGELVATSFSDVDNLFSSANMFLDKTIKLTGVVTHTCKHSGKRCFLAGATGDETIRVEAGGKISGFNRELIGSTITVIGVLKERRLNKEYIDQWEESIKEKAVVEDGSAETCEAENSNIKKMRQWMKEHGKDYYSIFFIEGIDYDIVN